MQRKGGRPGRPWGAGQKSGVRTRWTVKPVSQAAAAQASNPRKSVLQASKFSTGNQVRRCHSRPSSKTAVKSFAYTAAERTHAVAGRVAGVPPPQGLSRQWRGVGGAHLGPGTQARPPAPHTAPGLLGLDPPRPPRARSLPQGRHPSRAAPSLRLRLSSPGLPHLHSPGSLLLGKVTSEHAAAPEASTAEGDTVARHRRGGDEGGGSPDSRAGVLRERMPNGRWLVSLGTAKSLVPRDSSGI